MDGKDERANQRAGRRQRALEEEEHQDGGADVERERVEMEEQRRAAPRIPQDRVGRLRDRAIEAGPLLCRLRPVWDAPRVHQAARSVKLGALDDDRHIVVREAVADRPEVGSEGRERDDEQPRRAPARHHRTVTAGRERAGVGGRTGRRGCSRPEKCACRMCRSAATPSRQVIFFPSA